MPSHYTLRIQFGPHQNVDEITDQLQRLVQDASVDELMFFFFAEELNNGHDTLEQVKAWIDHSRPYREAMKRAGVIISLNPWHSLLHADRGRSLKPGQHWQVMEDPTGKCATATVCWLDPDWQSYYLETLRLYAREGFRVVWIDDDIRFHNHSPLNWGGCFCPRHVAEFNRRAGTQATREEIVRACLAPGEPHPWRALWMDMWQDTILQFLTQCRSILESGHTRMGLMSGVMEQHAAEGRRWEEWWRAFSEHRPPVHRPHFWTYSDVTGPHLLYGIATLDQNRSIQPEGTETGPEIECFPYGPWNKSYRQTFAKMALAHVMGSTHLNISLHDFLGNWPDDDPERTAFLKRVRPSMDWLADQFPLSLRSVGVGVPWSPDLGRKIHLAPNRTWFDLSCSSRGWCHWLGEAGIAFSTRPQKTVNALTGATVWGFDDDTLKHWLSGALLLDGEAAAILVERGFGSWIGVESAHWITQNDTLYAMEECRDEAFSRRRGGQISINAKNHTRRLFQGQLAASAHAISDLRGPRQDVVGHGAFIFTNAHGGRVAVVPWNAGVDAAPMMDIHRASQLRAIVQWLAGDQEVGRANGGAHLVPQFLTDGHLWRGVIWNASPDEIQSLHIHRPSGMPAVREAWHLASNGERQAVRVNGDQLHLSRPMYQWEMVVI